MAKAPGVSSNPSLSMLAVEPGERKAALAGAASTKTMNVPMVPVEGIRVLPGFNVRLTDDPEYRRDVDTIKASIRSEGYYPSKALTGFVGKSPEGDSVVYVRDGHQRLQAVQELNAEAEAATDPEAKHRIENLPVVILANSVTMRQHTIALHKENTGARLSMLSQAILVKRLLKDEGGDKATPDSLATELGVSAQHIKDLLALNSAPKSVRQAIKVGKIKPTLAVKLVRANTDKGDKDKGEAAVARAIQTAERVGKPSASAVDTEEGTRKGRTNARGANGEAKPKMLHITHDFTLTAGQKFDLKDIRAFAKLVPDSDWYSLLDDEEGKATATEDFTFSCKISRPDKSDGAPAKKGRKTAATIAAIAASPDDDDDDLVTEGAADEEETVRDINEDIAAMPPLADGSAQQPQDGADGL